MDEVSAARRSVAVAPPALRRWAAAAAQYLPAASLLVGLVVLWEVAVRVLGTKPYVLPGPLRIWDAFVKTRGLLPEHTQTTLTAALAGLAVAAAVGVALAAIIASVPLVRRVLYPILVVSQTIPMIVLAPLLAIWFGFGLTPKVVVVALVGFFPIVVSTVDAIDSADEEMVGLVRSMGARTWQVMRYVRIPSAVPGFFAGMKIASAYAVLAAIIGEWAGATSGLGIYIQRSQASYRIDQVFVAIVIVALLSVALFASVHVLSRIASPWKYVTQEGGQPQ